MKSLYIEIKSKDNRTYPALVADLGYTQRVITYDRTIIYEIAPVAPCVINSEPVGSKIEVI